MNNQNQVSDYRFGSVKVGEYKDENGNVKGRYARLGVLSSEGVEMPEGTRFTVRLEMIPPALLRGETAYINFSFPSSKKDDLKDDPLAGAEPVSYAEGAPF